MTPATLPKSRQCGKNRSKPAKGVPIDGLAGADRVPPHGSAKAFGLRLAEEVRTHNSDRSDRGSSNTPEAERHGDAVNIPSLAFFGAVPANG